MAGDGSGLPTPGKYLQNSPPPHQCWRGTPRRATAGAAAGAGRTLGPCALPPSTAPGRGCCPTQRCCSPASFLGLPRAAELSTEENQAERCFCQSLAPFLRHRHTAGTCHVPAVPRAHLAASPGRDGPSDLLAALLFSSSHRKCFSSIWGLWDILQPLVPMEEIPKASPTSATSAAWPLQPNKTGVKPGCLLKAAGPAAELSAQPRMLHPHMRGKHVFSMCWGHRLMFVQLQIYFPLLLFGAGGEGGEGAEGLWAPLQRLA